jgi:hypothetical protein
MTYKCPHHLRKQAFSSTAAGWKFAKFAAAAVGLLLFSPFAHSEALVDSALRLFLGNDSNTVGFDLDKSRPQAVSEAFKSAVVAGLPREGNIYKIKESDRRKLESLDLVLREHQRQSVYVARVFKSEPKPYAFVGLHERAVLLISDSALILLNAEELQASVAHEVGHEYVWRENLEATERHDNRRLKELELFCDGVAILTLRRVGLGPAPLLTAAERIATFNALSTGLAGNAERYPSADERKRFAQAIVNWADSHQISGVAK